ncbi:MAG TPA: MFS transporter [Mycobacteriales bacterium]|nr:MFS transporter [Mycobacteriales bacterium]HWC35515.1 MFS transporter [Mycobacteriales bacterium]
MRASSRSNTVILGQLSFLSGTAQEMIYPLIPTFVVVTLGSSKTLLGVIEGALAVGVTLARLGSAAAIDRGVSPKRILVGSYVASLLSRPLLAIAPNLATVGVLRGIDGLGKGGKDAPKDSLVALDAGEAKAGRAFGVLRALDTAGSVAGPIIAGLLLLWLGHGERGLRIVFALALLPAVAGLWTLRQVRDAPPRASSVDGGPRPPFPRAFKVLLVAALIFGLANSSDTLLLLRGQSAGLSAAGIAFAFALVNLVYAGLAIPLGSLSDRVGRRPLLLVAWAIYALTYAGFAVASRAWQLVLLFALYGVYYAAADGVIKAWIAGLVPGERQGAAYGLYAAASGLLVLPASVIAGALWDHVGPGWAFGFGAVVAALALAVIVVSPELRRPAATATG